MHSQNRLLLLIHDQQHQISALQSGDKPVVDLPRFTSPVSPLAGDAAAHHFRSGSTVVSALNSRRPSATLVSSTARPKRPSFSRTTSSQSYMSSHASAAGSPFVRPRSGLDDLNSLARSLDESTTNNVEAVTLQRENQKLKERIDELGTAFTQDFDTGLLLTHILQSDSLQRVSRLHLPSPSLSPCRLLSPLLARRS